MRPGERLGGRMAGWPDGWPATEGLKRIPGGLPGEPAGPLRRTLEKLLILLQHFTLGETT